MATASNPGGADTAPSWTDGRGDVPRLLDVMAKAKTAAPLLEELLDALPGWTADRLQDVLADAEADGLIDPWPESPAGMAIMLTSLAAGRLGLRLVGGESEVTSTGRFGLRWIPATAKPRPPKPAMRPLVHLISDLGDDGPLSLDRLADPRAIDTAEHAAGVEWFEARRRSAKPGQRGWTPQELLAKGVLKFIHLVGLRERWDGESYGEDCPSCLFLL